MAWGGGWGNRAPRYVEPVVRAWKEGRAKEISKGKGNEGVGTNGISYLVYGHVIAIHRHEELRLHYFKLALQGQHVRCSEWDYTFAGWPTKMTARHLTAIGMDADCYGIKNPKCYMRGKLVNCSAWYSPEEIAELVNPPPKPKRVIVPYVEPSGHLFPELCAA